MTRLNPPVLILAIIANCPTVLTAAPSGTPFIALTHLDLAPAANTRIGVDPSDNVVAIVTDEDGQILQVGLATFDKADKLMFGEADLREQVAELMLAPKALGKVLTVFGTYDARIVADRMVKAGLGTKVLSDVVVLGEGDTLTFGARAVLGGGTKIDDLTLIQIAGKSFGIVNIGDIVLVTALVQSGQTYVSGGVIGHIEGSMIADVTPSDLAAFGIGISPTSVVPPHLASAGHGAPLATAAA